MIIDWAVALPCFLTALVEWVEAFTIILAVSMSIGWRSASGAALCALGVLGGLTFLTGGILHLGAALPWLQYGIGVLLMLFGVRWLAKAVARGAGLKKMHDEEEEFAETRAQLTVADRRAAWAIAFKGMFLEGLEVWLVVVALCAKKQQWSSGVGAALAALVLTALIGLAVQKPLQRVPENLIKFCVGSMITAFGTYWSLEPLAGDAWGLGDWSLLGLILFYLLGGLALIFLFKKRQYQKESFT